MTSQLLDYLYDGNDVVDSYRYSTSVHLRGKDFTELLTVSTGNS